MAMDDALYQCETYSSTGILSHGVQPLEHAEEFACIGHVEAGPLSRTGTDRLPVQTLCLYLDDRPLPPTRELPGIGEHIVQ